ncbi:MAG: hypothetical protein QOI36_3430, partial [Pseudonocardiales bacterium]|nr:hypothetical protein [Pseudonocardiales bacterium]
DVPTTDGEHLYIDLWLINNHPPKGPGTRHIILDSLTR